MRPRASDTHERTRKWHLLAVLLAGLALAGGVDAWVGAATEPSPSGVSPAPTSTPIAAASPEGNPGALHPTRLTIRSIGVHAAVIPLGLNADHTVEVPADPDEAGWYRFGSMPGQPGSTVVLGHVDSEVGPAVFYRLKSMEIGDRIDIERADGSVVTFEVETIATYDNDQFPAQEVYRTRGPSGLTLVTCGGEYDATRGGYQANVVVSARPVGQK